MISYIGANKHHRQRKVVRRSTKRSIVQSTYNLSRGWMMLSEPMEARLGGKSCYATMTCHRSISNDGRSLRGYKNRCWFPDLGFQSVVSQMVSQNMVSQSKNGFPNMVSQIWFLNQKMVSQIWFPKYGFSIKKWFPKYGFSIKKWFHKKWFPKRWFLNQKMVSQNMVSQSKFGKLYVSKSDKCV